MTNLRTLKWLFVGALTAAAPTTASAQTVNISFVTTQTAMHIYAPRNIVAVWIEKPSGAFVRTLAEWAAMRKQYLLAWNTASAGNNVDAVTGATFSTQGTRTVSWDLTDSTKAVVPLGQYVLKLELADTDVSMATQNNHAAIPFTVANQQSSMMTNSGGFNNVMINVLPAGTVVDMATTQTPDLAVAAVDSSTAPGTMVGGCSAASGPKSTESRGWPGAIGASLLLLALLGIRRLAR